MFKGKLKSLKIVLKAQNMHFLRQNQVANKSPSQAAKHLRDKIFEKFSKCFLWLEGTPMRQSRRGPQKLLYNITTRASTHKQVAKPSRENLKHLKFWKIFLSLFRNWDVDPPVSCQKLLCKLATWLTHNQVARIGQHYFWNFCKNKRLSKNN